uniref:AlNc14C316G10528 protein n=1 Tax=Albugo laibachii Nc14 TaxID=890382 RepID=F0WW90_9STRA|nr:AlNc14C316G10528 [Albugo laibachii Nc14]|eukprot:CCA25710.1 AlNc14C316G10528 [Albugo laibachii Nc14]
MLTMTGFKGSEGHKVLVDRMKIDKQIRKSFEVESSISESSNPKPNVIDLEAGLGEYAMPQKLVTNYKQFKLDFEKTEQDKNKPTSVTDPVIGLGNWKVEKGSPQHLQFLPAARNPIRKPQPKVPRSKCSIMNCFE